MPRVPKSQVAPHQLYGTTKVDTGISFRERMRKLFRPGDTIEVADITNQLLQWQWLDEQDETYTIEEDTNIKITERDEPGFWELGPGETDVLSGANAYVMLDYQYKMICIMKIGVVLHPLDEREIRNFSLDDPEKQEQFLELAYKGTMDSSKMYRAVASNAKPQILENLQPLSTEESEYERRHREETQRFSRPQTTAAPHKELSDLASEFGDGSYLLGRATGGLPADRQRAPEPETGTDDEGPDDDIPDTETKPAKANAKKDKQPAKV